MRTMGVDPGLTATGYGVVEGETGRVQLLAAGVVRPPGKIPIPKRLSLIFQELEKIVREFKPDLIAVEEVYFAKNSSAAMATAQVVGVVALLCQEADFLSFSPREVKKWICGTGNASKEQVLGMVSHLLKLGDAFRITHCHPLSHHAADALALALCAVLSRS